MKKIFITGNVGKDPELRADTTGNSFVTFSVAISVGTKQNPKTDWVDVSCNGKLADFAISYVKKGTKVLIEGFPIATAYINKENKAIASLRVFVNNLELLSKKEQEHSNEEVSDSGYVAAPIDHANSQIGALGVDDIPF